MVLKKGKPDFYELLSILRYRRIRLNLLLILIAIALSFYILPIVPILFILTSNLFDILGYHFTLVRREKQLPDKEIVKAYRIIQLMFDLVLLILLGVIFDWVISVTGAVLKLFAIQDLLYYYFLNEKLPIKWNWLGFTPLGMIKKNLTYDEVIIQAAFGAILGYLFFFFL